MSASLRELENQVSHQKEISDSEKKEHEQTKSFYEAARRHNTFLTESKSQLDKEISQLSDSKRQDKAALAAQLEQIRTQMQEELSSKGDIQRELDACKQLREDEKERWGVERSRFHRMMEDQDRALGAVEEERNSLIFRFETMSGKCDAWETDFYSIRDHNTRLQEDQRIMEDERNAVENERDTMRNQRDTMRIERDTMRIERYAMEQERDALEQERDAWEQDRNAVENERDIMRNQRDAMRNARDDMEEQRNALEQDRVALEQEREDLRVELVELRQTMARQPPNIPLNQQDSISVSAANPRKRKKTDQEVDESSTAQLERETSAERSAVATSTSTPGRTPVLTQQERPSGSTIPTNGPWSKDEFMDPNFRRHRLPTAVLNMAKSQIRDWDVRSPSWAESKQWRCAASIVRKKPTRWLNGDEHACEYCEQQERLCIAVKHDFIKLLPVGRKGKEVGPNEVEFWVDIE